MHVGVLNMIISAAVVLAWIALAGYCRRCTRRREARHAEWARLAPSLSELDADLDLIWAAESARIGRDR